MRNFQYINREYVPPVDLNVLGQTYSTLEQGHQQSVQTSSDLQAAMAKLELNEAEEGWRQQKINEIRQTIKDNTVFGNAYGALDDLIAKKGDLLGDAGLIGRLQAQKDYLSFQQKVDSMKIPEGMKEMYKEENPYYYVPGSLDKSGKETKGSKWVPNSNPVNSIDRFEFMKEVLHSIAVEKGQYNNVMFLDADGNPTTDPMKSVDGAIYKQVGTRFEKLPKEKIVEALKSARASVLGAEDSFRQDFKYERWKYKKLLDSNKQNGDNSVPYIKGFTDDNGSPLNYEDWLYTQFDEFADKNKFTHTYPEIRYGSALENLRKREQKEDPNNIDFGGGSLIGGGGDKKDIVMPYVAPPGSSVIGYKSSQINAYAMTNNIKASSARQIFDIMKLNPKDYGNSVDKLIDSYKRNNITNTDDIVEVLKVEKRIDDEQAIYLKRAFDSYKTAHKNFMKLYDNIEDKESRDLLIFNEQAQTQNYTDESAKSKEILNELNSLFTDYDEIEYEIGKDVVKELCTLYGGNPSTSIEDLTNIHGISVSQGNDGKYHVFFSTRNQNLLPKFDHFVKLASGEVPGSIGNFISNHIGGVTKDSNYRIIYYKDDAYTNIDNNNRMSVGRKYGRFLRQAADVEYNLGTIEGNEGVSATGASTVGEIFIDEMYWLDTNEKGRRKKTYTERANELCKGFVLPDGGQIYLKDGNDVLNPVSKENEITKLCDFIGRMYREKPEEISRKWSPGTSQLDEGYIFTFNAPESMPDSTIHEGKPITLYVTGAIDDGSGFSYRNNPTWRAQSLINTAKAVKGPIDINDFNEYDRYFGETIVNLNIDTDPISNNKTINYNTSFLGTPYEPNEKQVSDYLTAMFRLDETIYGLNNGLLDPGTKEFKYHLEAIIATLANSTGNNTDAVRRAIDKYMDSK